MRALLALALASLFVPSASAAETSWQEIAPGVQLRLISSGKIKPDGSTLVGLEIDMPADTKTYWRVPGDTGLPTELDFTGSVGIVHHAIHWPFPTREEAADVLDYVYYGPVVLPIALDLAPGAAQLELSAVLGICSDICIPAQASFSLPLLDARPDMPNGVKLKQALARAPIAWPEAQAAFGAISYDRATHRLMVPVLSSEIDKPSLIVTAPSREPLFGTPEPSPDPGVLAVPLLLSDAQIDWTTQPVELTFMTDGGAFVITQTVHAEP